MVDLFTIVTSDELRTFLREKEKYSLVRFSGEAFYPYTHNRISDCITKYIDALKNELSYESANNFTFSLAFDDEISKVAICEKITQITNNAVIDVNWDDFSASIMQKLSKKTELHIEKYGINFGKFSYKIIRDGNNQVVKGAFSLTAYTVPLEGIEEIIS